MNRNIVLLLIGLLFCAVSNGQSVRDNFKRALNAKNMTKAEEILKAWNAADANDPELYISYFNFFTVKSLEKDSTTCDRQYAQKALEFISEGIKRFPTRLDMWIAKIYMYARIKDFATMTSTTLQFIEYAKKIDNNWKGEGYSLINNSERVFLQAVVEFQEKIFAAKDPTLYKNIIQISEATLKYYPKNVPSLQSLSTIYLEQKNYDKSLEVLLKAKDIEPSNAILLYNIAGVYGFKGDKANARRYYELTAARATSKEQRLKEAALQQIDALK